MLMMVGSMDDDLVWMHYRNLRRVRLVDGTGHLLVRAGLRSGRLRGLLLMVVAERVMQVQVVAARWLRRERGSSHLRLLL